MTDDRAVIKEPVLTISTDNGFPVENLSFQYKFQVPSTSQRFVPKLRANRELQILQSNSP